MLYNKKNFKQILIYILLEHKILNKEVLDNTYKYYRFITDYDVKLQNERINKKEHFNDLTDFYRKLVKKESIYTYLFSFEKKKK